jgi:cell division protein FtsB
MSLTFLTSKVTLLFILLISAVSKANFVYHFCIGKGGFGKVWRVERKKAKQYYAMKEMSKARIITKRSVKSVINER